MGKKFKDLFTEASRVQSEMVAMNVLATAVETHVNCIKIRCVCWNIEECGLVIAMLKKSSLLQPGGMGFIRTIPDSDALCIEVKIDIDCNQ